MEDVDNDSDLDMIFIQHQELDFDLLVDEGGNTRMPISMANQ